MQKKYHHSFGRTHNDMPNPKKPRLYYERLSQMDLQLNREKTRLSLEQLKVNARVAIHDISGDFNHSGTTSVMDDSFEWWTLEEPPVGMKQYLIAIFMEHASQVHFTPHAASLHLRLTLYPQTHPSYPSPCLLNAIYLLSSFYLSSPSHPYRNQLNWSAKRAEEAYLEKARRELSRNLAKGGEAILDAILTMELLARYTFFIGKLQEGHNESSGAMRIASTCNLHAIASVHPDSSALTSPSILAPATNELELYDRINAFWGAFILDRAGSICSGLEVALSDDKISTPFPKQPEALSHFMWYSGPSPLQSRPSALPSQSYPSPILSPEDEIGSSDTPSTQDALSVVALLNPRSVSLNVSEDTHHIIEAKIFALLEMARRVLIRVTELGAKLICEVPPSVSSRILSMDASITTMISSLPAFPPLVPLPDAALAQLANCHTLAHTAVIILYSPFSGKEMECRDKCLKAARSIVDILPPLEETSEAWWPLPIKIGWCNAAEIFQQEISRLMSGRGFVPPGDQPECTIMEMRKDMEYMLGIAKRLGKVYPVGARSVECIETLLAKT